MAKRSPGAAIIPVLPSKPAKYKGASNGPPKLSGGGRDANRDADIELDTDDGDGLGDDDAPFDSADIDALLDAVPKSRTGSGRRSVATIFPTPPSYRMSWDIFCQYWRKCFDDPQLRPRLRIYIYRMYPVMLEGFRQVDKLTGQPDAHEPEKLAKPLTIDDILHRYGAGDYHFKVNDSGAGNKQVAQCHLTGHSRMRSWTEHPPVLDPKGVDEGDPSNKNFLIQLRRHMQQAEEGDMASAEIIERMSEKMVDLASRNSQAGASNDASAVMAEAAKQAISIVAETAKQHGRHDTGQQQTAAGTMELLGGFMQLMREMRPPDNTTATIVDMMQRAAEREQAMAQRHTEFVTAMLKQTMEARQLEKPAKGPIEQLTELAESRDALRSILGGGGGKRGPDWMEALPAFAPAITAGMQALHYAAMGYFQSKGGAGAPMPGMGGAMPSMVGQGAMGGMQQLAGPSTPGMPTGAPNAGGAVGSANSGVDDDGENILVELQDQGRLVAFLDQFQRPFMRMLNSPDATGEDLANWLADWRGENAYLQIASLGRDTLLQLLAMYPPIGQQLQGRGDVVGFVEEFLVPAVAMANDDSDTGDGDDNAETGPVNGAASAASPGSSYGSHVHDMAGSFEYPKPAPEPEAESHTPATSAPTPTPRQRPTIGLGKPDAAQAPQAAPTAASPATASKAAKRATKKAAGTGGR